MSVPSNNEIGGAHFVSFYYFFFLIIYFSVFYQNMCSWQIGGREEWETGTLSAIAREAESNMLFLKRARQ